MRMLVALAILVASLILALPALANIPVNDAAQLDRHAQTAGATTKLVPLTGQRKDANTGIKCSVTTGKQGSVKDPAIRPVAGAGAKVIQKYDPSMPAVPAAYARGGLLASQTHFSTTGNVIGDIEASRSSLAAAQDAFRTAGLQAGSAPALMGAIDMNSAARVQNGLAWNGAIDSANVWLTAINALNLALASDASRAAAAMEMGSGGQSRTTYPACPAGMAGNATSADPCRLQQRCSAMPLGTTPDPACVSARVSSNNGNVLFYLARAQAQNNADAADALIQPMAVPAKLAGAHDPPPTLAAFQGALQSIDHSH